MKRVNINMPEIENNQAAGEEAGEKPVENAGEGQDQGTDDKKEPENNEAGNEDAGGDDDKGGEGKGEEGKEPTDPNAKAPQKGKDTSKEGDDEPDDGKDPEVKPRMSTKDFIIQRQQRKLGKLNKPKEGEDKESGGEAGDDNDDEIAPEDEELITKVVSKKFAPIIDKTLATEDEQEIQSFLKDNPDFKPFEAKARRFMQHPSRRQLPIKSIFYEVAGDKLIKIGAQRQKKADEDAKNTQTGGGSNRAPEGKKDDWSLSEQEFEEKQEKIRRGQQ